LSVGKSFHFFAFFTRRYQKRQFFSKEHQQIKLPLDEQEIVLIQHRRLNPFKRNHCASKSHERIGA